MVVAEVAAVAGVAAGPVGSWRARTGAGVGGPAEGVWAPDVAAAVLAVLSGLAWGKNV